MDFVLVQPEHSIHILIKHMIGILVDLTVWILVPNYIVLSKQLSNDSLCYVQFRYFYELW
jgi:hypothetical protein